MGTHSAAVALYPKLAYHPLKNFEPIGLAAGTLTTIAFVPQIVMFLPDLLM